MPKILLLLLVATYCAVEAASIKKQEESAHRVSKAHREFSLRLYKQLAKRHENMVFSGFSTSTILTMLLQGSDGETANEIRSALRLDHLSSDRLEDGYKKIIRDIRGNDKYSLSTANSIWVEEDKDIDEEYRNKVRDTFAADIKPIRHGNAKKDINEYVAENTKGLIEEILGQEPDEYLVSYLVNVIHFRGSWKIPFSSESHTTEGKFLNTTTKIMHLKDALLRHANCEELNAEIVELPYEGDEMKLLIILPKDGSTLNELEHRITCDKLERAVEKMKEKKLSLTIPKFQIKTKLNMVDDLARLGIKKLFTHKADLTKFAKNVTVSNVLQTAILDVTEYGTQAAAAPAIETEYATEHDHHSEVKAVRVERPFMFQIRHEATNTVLFSGRHVKAVPYHEDEY